MQSIPEGRLKERQIVRSELVASVSFRALANRPNSGAGWRCVSLWLRLRAAPLLWSAGPGRVLWPRDAGPHRGYHGSQENAASYVLLTHYGMRRSGSPSFGSRG